MKDDYKSAVTITSPDEFEAALAAVIETAIESDVDIGGAWEFRTGEATDDWEVNVTELAKRTGGENS
ncbi:hypothetical protein [Haloarcula sediminis]|uniref:hypothetical protein n=1 Tax=Haloarcula sediminis TaxID=3111777 RepID=UPI002D790DC1|nr:hypothetical protein [Haloarcula sp. CK38]